MIQTIITGIISGIISSMLFYIFIFGIKPRIDISNQICLERHSDRNIYVVKVVNKSRTFITNVKYQMILCKKSNDGNVSITTIHPLKEPMVNIDKYLKKTTDFAVQISYEMDEKLFDKNSYLEFTFEAYHSFSNAMRVKQKKYTIKDVQKGRFETGKSMIILSTD